jgi:hypothetical protein
VLAQAHGYTVLYVCANSVNALLLRQDLLTPHTIQHLTLDLVFPAESPGLHALYLGQRPWYEVKAWHGSSLLPQASASARRPPMHGESGTQDLDHAAPRQLLHHAHSMQAPAHAESVQEPPHARHLDQLPHAQHPQPPLLRASQGAADGERQRCQPCQPSYRPCLVTRTANINTHTHTHTSNIYIYIYIYI